MSALDTMSAPERRSWATLIADGLVFIWFWKAVTPVGTWLPADRPAEELGGVFFALIIVTIIVHAVIAAMFERRRRTDGVEQDERDVEVQAHGAKAGYAVMQWGVGILICLTLMGYIAPENFEQAVVIRSVVQLLFAMVALAYIADLTRHAVILLRYRAG
ncbi:MAG: hypothetical protein WBG08_04470 [Litorimonas sp.]